MLTSYSTPSLSPLQPLVAGPAELIKKLRDAERNSPSINRAGTFGICPYPCKNLPPEITTNTSGTKLLVQFQDGCPKWNVHVHHKLRKIVTVTFEKNGRVVPETEYFEYP
eukprot:TRINITY_DN67747_c3_g1_i1.p1 TRINITY_DN67747_c3_g1~~TRINITY_DN67747_c3_g1_i1.p1  ORF type:complete len:110 (-),score=4.41 TRINITY_DN67747_c3_g1_i1:852-1181(-)